MTELKRPTRFINDPEHGAGRADAFEYYAPDEVDALLSERDRREGELRARLDGYRAALWLCMDNVGGFLHADGSPFVGVPTGDTMFASIYAQCEAGKEPRLSILCSDTFAYACADAEEVAYPQASEVLAIAQDEGWPGLVRWIQHQRQERGEEAKPLAEVSRRMSDLDRIRGERDEARAELAALRQQVREVTEWRPMETAPRDGSTILGLYHGRRWATIWYSESEDYVSQAPWEFAHGGDRLGAPESDFTGWLPLPPLPKEVERG